MIIYELKKDREAYRDSGNHGCTAILWHFEWWAGGKLCKVGDEEGEEDISAG